MKFQERRHPHFAKHNALSIIIFGQHKDSSLLRGHEEGEEDDLEVLKCGVVILGGRGNVRCHLLVCAALVDV